MLKLQEFFKSTGIKQKKFYENVMISKQYLHNILRKGKIPTLHTAFKIEKETKGNVSMYDWCIEPEKKTGKNGNDNHKDKINTK